MAINIILKTIRDWKQSNTYWKLCYDSLAWVWIFLFLQEMPMNINRNLQHINKETPTLAKKKWLSFKITFDQVAIKKYDNIACYVIYLMKSITNIFHEKYSWYVYYFSYMWIYKTMTCCCCKYICVYTFIYKRVHVCANVYQCVGILHRIRN